MEKFKVILRDETPDYINASYVKVSEYPEYVSCNVYCNITLKGYKQNRAFIVAQSPMENTNRDFWRMIYNLKCATIVMLCELVENNQVRIITASIARHIILNAL